MPPVKILIPKIPFINGLISPAREIRPEGCGKQYSVNENVVTLCPTLAGISDNHLKIKLIIAKLCIWIFPLKSGGFLFFAESGEFSTGFPQTAVGFCREITVAGFPPARMDGLPPEKMPCLPVTAIQKPRARRIWGGSVPVYGRAGPGGQPYPNLQPFSPHTTYPQLWGSLSKPDAPVSDGCAPFSDKAADRKSRQSARSLHIG